MKEIVYSRISQDTIKTNVATFLELAEGYVAEFEEQGVSEKVFPKLMKQVVTCLRRYSPLSRVDIYSGYSNEQIQRLPKKPYTFSFPPVWFDNFDYHLRYAKQMQETGGVMLLKNAEGQWILPKDEEEAEEIMKNNVADMVKKKKEQEAREEKIQRWVKKMRKKIAKQTAEYERLRDSDITEEQKLAEFMSDALFMSVPEDIRDDVYKLL